MTFILFQNSKYIFQKFYYYTLEIQDKIQAEIEEIVGNDRLPSLEDRNDMHFTNAFILESFRYTSFVPLVFHSALKDVSFKGYTIPKDTAGKTNVPY